MLHNLTKAASLLHLFWRLSGLSMSPSKCKPMNIMFRGVLANPVTSKASVLSEGAGMDERWGHICFWHPLLKAQSFHPGHLLLLNSTIHVDEISELSVFPADLTLLGSLPCPFLLATWRGSGYHVPLATLKNSQRETPASSHSPSRSALGPEGPNPSQHL